MIKIVDYGLGNILAFQSMYKRLNVATGIARCADDLAGATKVILPGVGAFDHAMELLNGSGMREPLDVLARSDEVSILGICVGMQILADSSEEGRAPGLGWVPGRVRAFKALGIDDQILPHMGWNDVEPTGSTRLFEGLHTDARFYFLHSFYFECEQRDHVAAISNYGVDFSSVVNRGNIYGVQFHPEKSHHWGTQLLKNFAAI